MKKNKPNKISKALAKSKKQKPVKQSVRPVAKTSSKSSLKSPASKKEAPKAVKVNLKSAAKTSTQKLKTHSIKEKEPTLSLKGKPVKERALKEKVVKKNDLDDDLLESDSDLDLEQDEMKEYAAELEMVEEEDIEIETSSSVVSVWNSESMSDADTEVVLTDAEGRRYCRAKDCDQVGLVDGYCRYHYLLLWKKIQVRRKILTDGKLQRYVEELTSRYPDKFLEVIRKDLRTEKDFLMAIQELEIDESAGDSDYEEDTNFIEEVRGMGESSASVDDDDF